MGRAGPDARLTIEDLKVHDVEARLAGTSVNYRVSGYDLVKQSGQVVSHIAPRRDAVDLTLVLNPAGAWVVSNVIDLGS
jgi:hypothetical protein